MILSIILQVRGLLVKDIQAMENSLQIRITGYSIHFSFLFGIICQDLGESMGSLIQVLQIHTGLVVDINCVVITGHLDMVGLPIVKAFEFKVQDYRLLLLLLMKKSVFLLVIFHMEI